MGWLRKNFKKAKKKLKKFFKSDVGKVIGTVALAVAGFYMFGPTAVTGGGTTAETTAAADAAAKAAAAAKAGAGAGAIGKEAVIADTAAAAAAADAAAIAEAAKIGVGTKVVTTAPVIKTVDALTKGTGDALTRGAGVTDVGTITGTTQEFGKSELASNIIDTANVNVSNGNHIISNNLTDATEETINLFEQQTAVQKEYINRNLGNLAENMQPSIDATSKIIDSTIKPIEASGPNLLDPNFETNLINDNSFASMKFDSAAYNPEFSGPTGPEQGYYLGKNLGLPDDNFLQASRTKIGEALTSDYATGSAQGVTTGLLTNVIMGQGEEGGGGGQLVSYDKSIGNARNYVADISQQYQNKTGQVLPFNMFTNTTMPLYGPSSPQNITRNPYIT